MPAQAPALPLTPAQASAPAQAPAPNGPNHRGCRTPGGEHGGRGARLAARCGYPAKVDGVSDLADPGYEINENGGLLPGPGAILAGPTFDEPLSQQYPG